MCAGAGLQEHITLINEGSDVVRSQFQLPLDQRQGIGEKSKVYVGLRRVAAEMIEQFGICGKFLQRLLDRSVGTLGEPVTHVFNLSLDP